MGMDVIRQAILANHGGLQNASDNEIKTIWNSLPSEVQGKYLQNLEKERKDKNASGNTSKRKV